MSSLTNDRTAERNVHAWRMFWVLGAILPWLASDVATASDMGHEIADQVRQASLRSYLYTQLYTREGHNRGFWGPEHDLARDNIAALFASCGLDVELQFFDVDGVTGTNVIATKQGTTYPDAQYILGAHYDSVGNPGADDDASGVAGSKTKYNKGDVGS